MSHALPQGTFSYQRSCIYIESNQDCCRFRSDVLARSSHISISSLWISMGSPEGKGTLLIAHVWLPLLRSPVLCLEPASGSWMQLSPTESFPSPCSQNSRSPRSLTSPKQCQQDSSPNRQEWLQDWRRRCRLVPRN